MIFIHSIHDLCFSRVQQPRDKWQHHNNSQWKISFCLCPDFWVDFQMPLLKIPIPKQKYGGGGVILIVFTESSSLSCGIIHLHSPLPSLCFLKHPLSMLLIEVEVAYFYYHASAMIWKLTEYLAHSSSSTRHWIITYNKSLEVNSFRMDAVAWYYLQGPILFFSLCQLNVLKYYSSRLQNDYY